MAVEPDPFTAVFGTGRGCDARPRIDPAVRWWADVDERADESTELVLWLDAVVEDGFLRLELDGESPGDPDGPARARCYQPFPRHGHITRVITIPQLRVLLNLWPVELQSNAAWKPVPCWKGWLTAEGRDRREA